MRLLQTTFSLQRMKQLTGISTFNRECTPGTHIVDFCPKQNMRGTVKPIRRRAIVTLQSDGNFEVIAKPSVKTKTTLIQDLPHGRLSRSVDGSVLLTLRFSYNESRIDEKIRKEGAVAAAALVCETLP